MCISLDYWGSRKQHETFKKQNRMYEIIDKRCDALTRKELEIGKFFRPMASSAGRKSKD